GLFVTSNSFIGLGTSQANSNSVLLTGAGTLWSNQNNFTLGNSSSANRLVVSNGATVFTGRNGLLGVNTGANSNTVMVTDPNSHWSGGGLSSFLYVGSNAPFNRLIVSNGAVADRWEFSYLGFSGTSLSNAAVVTGAGSLWSNLGPLVIGFTGVG